MPTTDHISIRFRVCLLLALSGLLFGGCATTGRMQEDPLKNTKKLVVEGHVSLYKNGAFKVPNTSITLIPAGPSALEFAGELAGIRARQSLETSLRNAADSVYIVSEGTKLTYRISKNISAATNADAEAIRKRSRENSILLVDRSSELGKSIVGKSWEFSKETFRSGQERGSAVIESARTAGDAVSEEGTRKGTGLAAGSLETSKEIMHESSSAGTAISETGTKQGTELAARSLRAAKDMSVASAGRSASALKYGAKSFVKGYAAVPSHMKKHAGEIGDSLRDAKFGSAFAAENERRKKLSQATIDLMSATASNYGTDVANTFSKAGKELQGYRTTGVGFAALKSLRWALQGILWDATIEPLTKMTAASVGYIGVNFLAFPSLVVVREGIATTEVAVEVTWNTAKMGYDIVAPTGTAALAGVYSLVDFTASHAVAGATGAIGTVAGLSEAGASKTAGAAVKAGGAVAAGATAVGGTAAGYTEAGASKVAGVVIKGAGYAAGTGVQYIGIPLASAGIALGGGTIGTAVGGVGVASGGAVFVTGETAAGTAQVFGNVIAGTTLVAGTAIAAGGGTAYGAYELSKAVVVPSGYELGSGVVLSYGTLSHIGAHAILAASDCAYVVLSLEGPRWVIYAIKGNVGTGEDLPPGAIVDLNAMHKAGEEVYYLPVSDREMDSVVQSVYDTLPEVPQEVPQAPSSSEPATAGPEEQKR